MSENLETVFRTLDKVLLQLQQLTEGLSKQKIPSIIPDWSWHLRYAVTNKEYINNFHELPKNTSPVSREDFVIEFCRGRKVLHVGCADEGFLEQKIRDGVLLHQKLFAVSRHLVGIDISAEGVELLRGAGLENVFVCDADNVEKLPYKDFDVVLLGEVLEHLPNPGKALQALKIFSDADFLISVPNAYSWQGINFVKRGIEYVHPDHCFYFSFSTLQTLLRKCGYRIADLRFYTAHLKNPDLAGRLKEQPYFGEGIICIARIAQSKGDISEIKFTTAGKSFEETISLLDYQLRTDENTLAEMHSELSTFKEKLGEVLTQFQKALTETQTQREQLQNKDNEISGLQRELTNREQKLAEMMEQLQVKDKTLLELHQILSDKEKDCSALRQTISEQLQDKEQKIADLQKELKEREQELSRMVEQLQGMDKALSELQLMLSNKEKELSASQQTLTQIHNSLTWRFLRKYDTVINNLLPEGTRRRLWYNRIFLSIGNLSKKGGDSKASETVVEPIEENIEEIKHEEPKDDRIRLMVFIHSMEMGGAERCASVLLEHIDRARIIPEVVTIFDREIFYKIPDDVNVHILEKLPEPPGPASSISLPPGLQQYSNSLAWMERAALKLAGVVNVQQPHVILAHGFFASNIALLSKKHIPSSTRLVASAHCSLSPEKTGGLHAFLIRTLFKNADRVVAVSSGVALELKALPGMTHQKVVTIPNPLDQRQILNLSDEQITENPWFSGDIPVVLFVGRLAKVKGIDYLLRALSIVKNSTNVRCVLIGEGEEKENLGQLAGELGIADDVLFLGRQRNPFKFMKKAAVFVLPSLTEGLPYVLVEALTCGCPVIATDSPGGGSAEILNNGKYGILVPPGDEKALSQVLLKLLKDDELRREFSRLALLRSGDFGMESSMKIYKDVLFKDLIKIPDEKRHEDDRTRVMVFIHSMAMGGAERCISVLLNEMNRTKIIPELVTVYDKEMCYAIPEDVKVHILEKQPAQAAPRSDFTLPPNLQDFAKDLSWLEQTAFKLSGVILARRSSVILAQDFFASVILLLARKHIPANIKLIVSVRCMLSMLLPTKKAGELYSFLIRSLFNEADSVIANSKGVAEELKTAFGVNDHKVSVVYNSVNPVKLRYLADEPAGHDWFHEGVPILLFVGWLEPYKGVSCLLKAVSMVKKSARVRCVLIGEGKEENDLRQLTGELGIVEEVLFLGRQQNPFKFMRRSTVFILPSLTEGSPNVLLEALACGCPIIAADTPGGGPAEILKGGEYGLLVPPGDEKALFEAILGLLRDEELRRRLSKLALQRARDFDVGSSVQAYETLFLKETKEDAEGLTEEQRDDRALVMIVIPTMGLGGAERCVSVLLNHIDRSIIKPELVTIFDREPFYRVPYDVKVHVLETQPKPSVPASGLSLPLNLTEYQDNYLWMLMTAFKLADIVRKRRPSTIMAQDYFASLIVLLAKEYIPQKIKLIVSAHNSPSGLFSTAQAGGLYTFLTKRLFNEADNIISVSEGVTLELKTDFGVEPENIITLHNPVDLAQIQSMAVEEVTEHHWFSENIPIILFVGGLAPRKGLTYLFESLSLLKNSERPRCVLIGDGEEKENLQQLAEKLGIAENVVFLGRQQNPFKFMRKAAMFVLPSLTEGLPYVLVEALACGCPIIATDSPGGGPAEILKNGEYGLLVPPGDEKALAEAIKGLLQDNELRQKISGKALKRANEFDLRPAIKAYENIFSN